MHTLFNDDVGNPDCMASNNWVTLNYKLEDTLKESAAAKF
jgi:hypothetical protein